MREPDRVLYDRGRCDTVYVGLQERGGRAERECWEVRAGKGEESSLSLGLGGVCGVRTCWGSGIVLGGIVLLLGLFRLRMRSIPGLHIAHKYRYDHEN